MLCKKRILGASSGGSMMSQRFLWSAWTHARCQYAPQSTRHSLEALCREESKYRMAAGPPNPFHIQHLSRNIRSTWEVLICHTNLYSTTLYTTSSCAGTRHCFSASWTLQPQIVPPLQGALQREAGGSRPPQGKELTVQLCGVTVAVATAKEQSVHLPVAISEQTDASKRGSGPLQTVFLVFLQCTQVHSGQSVYPWKCRECDLALCLIADRNYFVTWHT